MTRYFAAAKVVALFVGFSLLVALSACKRREETGSTPARPKLKPPKAAIVPSSGADLFAQVALGMGAASGLSNPRGVAIDSSGNIYVADSGNSRVVKFDPSGKELAAFGENGTGPGQLRQPWCVAVSRDGSVLVLDRETAWINVFKPDGRFLNRIGGPDAGFYFPGGMAVSSEGNIVITDTGTNRLVVLNPEGKRQGDPLTVVAGELLDQPTDVSVDSRGGIHVYQTAGRRNPSLLLHLGPSGGPQSIWTSVDAPSTLDSPRTVFGPDGRLFMTDPEKKRVLVYSADGKTWHAVKLAGLEAHPLELPSGIAMDSVGRLYVVDARAGVVYCLKLATSG